MEADALTSEPPGKPHRVLLSVNTVGPKVYAAAAAAKSLQSCPSLRDPIDGSPPGSPIPVLLENTGRRWVASTPENAY